jgi:hypothetical protein
MAPAVFQVPPWRYCRLRVSSSTPSSRPSIVPGDFAGDAPDQEIRHPAGDGVAPCPAPTRLAVRRRPARAGREPASARRHPATRRAGRRVRRRLLLALLPRAQPPPQDQHQLAAPEVPWHRPSRPGHRHRTRRGRLARRQDLGARGPLGAAGDRLPGATAEGTVHRGAEGAGRRVDPANEAREVGSRRGTNSPRRRSSCSARRARAPGTCRPGSRPSRA